MVKNLPSVKETWVRSMGQEDPLEKGVVVLPRKSHEQRSLDSPWGQKKSDMTEQLTCSI